MDIIKEALDLYEATVAELLATEDPNIPVEDVRGTVWQSIIDDLQTAHDEVEKERHQVKLSGDTGRWVRLDHGYQDEVPAGEIGVIVREYPVGPGEEWTRTHLAWDVFVPRVTLNYEMCTGTVVTVPRGSLRILEEVR